MANSPAVSKKRPIEPQESKKKFGGKIIPGPPPAKKIVQNYSGPPPTNQEKICHRCNEAYTIEKVALLNQY